MDTPAVAHRAALEPEQALDMDTSKATPELWAALVKAQRAVKTVGKDGRNKQKDYNYATSEAMIKAGRAHLNDAGLVLLQTFQTEPAPASQGNIGNQHVCSIVRMPWLLAHEGGGVVSGVATMAAIGSPARPNDKAEAATVTYALGFVIRGLLQIDRAEEDDLAVDQRPEPEPDRLWLAYEAKRDAVARARKLTTEVAHTLIRETAGVRYADEPTDAQVEAMIAAAERLLQPPREPLTPGEDRERATAKGEQQTEPGPKGKGPKGKGKAAPKADAAPELTPEQQAAKAELIGARKAFSAAGKAYAEECNAQGVKPRPWQEIASKAIGRPWLETEPHTAAEWTLAADAFEQEIDHVRRGEAAA